MLKSEVVWGFFGGKKGGDSLVQETARRASDDCATREIHQAGGGTRCYDDESQK